MTQNTWSTFISSPISMDNTPSFVFQKQIYLLSEFTKTSKIFDIETDTWTSWYYL